MYHLKRTLHALNDIRVLTDSDSESDNSFLHTLVKILVDSMRIDGVTSHILGPSNYRTIVRLC